MKFLALFIFCGSVQSVPVTIQSDLPLFALEDEVKNDDDAHYLEKESVPNQCSNLLESEDSFEQPSRLSLPTLMTLSNEDAPQNLDDDEIVSDMIYQPMDLMLPAEFGTKELLPPIQLMRAHPPLPWSRWMNDMTYMQDPILENSIGSPFQLPRYMSERYIPLVKSLPPVSMQIHESIKEMNNYESNDELDMENVLYRTPNVRAVRSREEEFLKQLEHDAMIPNIIPTMPVPFVRTAASPEYQAIEDTPLVMVIYPGRVSDCALPFLFSCSPKIAYGSLAQTPYSGYSSIPSAVPNPEYREEPGAVKSDEVNQVIEVKKN